MSDRLLSTVDLKVGDCVVVAVELTDKTTGMPYWWRRFACVMEIDSPRFVKLMTLRPKIDEDRDIREVDVTKDVVTLVEREKMPQGVAAMFMKYVTLGRIKLD